MLFQKETNIYKLLSWKEDAHRLSANWGNSMRVKRPTIERMPWQQESITESNGIFLWRGKRKRVAFMCIILQIKILYTLPFFFFFFSRYLKFYSHGLSPKLIRKKYSAVQRSIFKGLLSFHCLKQWFWWLTVEMNPYSCQKAE